MCIILFHLLTTVCYGIGIQLFNDINVTKEFLIKVKQLVVTCYIWAVKYYRELRILTCPTLNILFQSFTDPRSTFGTLNFYLINCDRLCCVNFVFCSCHFGGQCLKTDLDLIFPCNIQFHLNQHSVISRSFKFFANFIALMNCMKPRKVAF